MTYSFVLLSKKGDTDMDWLSKIWEIAEAGYDSIEDTAINFIEDTEECIDDALDFLFGGK